MLTSVFSKLVKNVKPKSFSNLDIDCYKKIKLALMQRIMKQNWTSQEKKSVASIFRSWTEVSTVVLV